MTTTEVETPEEVETEETAERELPFVLEDQDDVTKAITAQVLVGLDKIDEANALLSEDNRAGVQVIDKALREYKGDDEELKTLWKARVEAEKVAKEAIDKVRNHYRVSVLHEDAIEEPEVDKEAIKASRKVVLDSLTALKGFATINGNQEVLDWIENLQIPQVGREGVTIVGQKKARVYVTVGEQQFNSFGEAAKALSDAKNPVTSTDLNQAWADSGESPEFEFNGETVKVRPKPTKKELEAAEEESAEDLMSTDFEGTESTEES